MTVFNSKPSFRHLNSFFVEIILVVLFFAFSCAILIKVFANSYVQNKNADNINMAVITAQSFDNMFSSNGDLTKTVESMYGKSAAECVNNDYVVLFLDSQGKYSGQSGVFKIVISCNEDVNNKAGVIKSADISVLSDDGELVRLTSSVYVPEGKEIAYE